MGDRDSGGRGVDRGLVAEGGRSNVVACGSTVVAFGSPPPGGGTAFGSVRGMGRWYVGAHPEGGGAGAGASVTVGAAGGGSCAGSQRGCGGIRQGSEVTCGTSN